LSLQPRPEITGLEICSHGGVDYAEVKALGLGPDDVLDFSISTNPFMPPPGIRETLKNIAMTQYPDSDATELRERLSRHLGVPPENILAGNGTTELIRLIALAYFRPADCVLILEPTYGEYEVACQIAGARLFKQRGKEGDSFTPRIEETVKIIRDCRPGGVFICNPNNPTGKYLSRGEIESVLDACADSLLVLDEAYIAFVEESWHSLELITRENVIILRSMTKEYGMPGLRLGYAVASQGILDNLRRVRPPWNVNGIAQRIGTDILDSQEYLEQSKIKIREAKQYLLEELFRLGYEILPSDANYFLVKVGNARKFRAALLGSGILVRDCTSFGLPGYVRIAPRTMSECEKLITTIGSILPNSQ